jgi:hypothetical protein
MHYFECAGKVPVFSSCIAFTSWYHWWVCYSFLTKSKLYAAHPSASKTGARTWNSTVSVCLFELI